MRRTARTGAVVALATAAALTATAGVADDVAVTPASASQCPAAHLCVWSSTAYGGAVHAVSSTSVSSTGILLARSVWNRSSYAANVYSGTAGAGSATCFEPGEQISSTSVSARSFRLLTTTSC